MTGFEDTNGPVAGLGATPDAPDPITAVSDVIAEHLGGDAYFCTRVWEAWGVGTMSANDFEPIVDDDEFIHEMATAAIAAYRKATEGAQ